jgi:hypothetical protein
MRLILVYHARGRVWFAVALLHIALVLGWIGEALWHASVRQMNRARALAERAGVGDA